MNSMTPTLPRHTFLAVVIPLPFLVRVFSEGIIQLYHDALNINLHNHFPNSTITRTSVFEPSSCHNISCHIIKSRFLVLPNGMMVPTRTTTDLPYGQTVGLITADTRYHRRTHTIGSIIWRNFG